MSNVWESFLLTTVVQSVHVSYCSLPSSLSYSDHSSSKRNSHLAPTTIPWSKTFRWCYVSHHCLEDCMTGNVFLLLLFTCLFLQVFLIKWPANVNTQAYFRLIRNSEFVRFQIGLWFTPETSSVFRTWAENKRIVFASSISCWNEFKNIHSFLIFQRD